MIVNKDNLYRINEGVFNFTIDIDELVGKCEKFLGEDARLYLRSVSYHIQDNKVYVTMTDFVENSNECDS